MMYIVTLHKNFSAMRQLLSTKFFTPTPAPNLLTRPRLIKKLNQGSTRKLTLVSASAGFGKSTLLSQWTSTLCQPVSWLSLDANDDDPFRFLTYFIGAFERINSNIGKEVLEILNSAQSPPYDVILTLLINELVGIPDHFTLVLDDYHFVNDAQIHKIISFVVGNMPDRMHLVISTRLVPPLPLS
jgi:LuxR family maltose regulon positive regulatory protein